MSSSQTIYFLIDPESRGKLLLMAHAEGYKGVEPYVQALVYQKLGQLPPPVPVEVERLRPNEVAVLSLLRQQAFTITEMIKPLGMLARANLDPYVKSLVAQGFVEEGRLRRTGSRPARTYVITLAGIAMLEREAERIKAIEKRNRIVLGKVQTSTRKQEKVVPIPPELAGTAEGAYVSALFTYGTGTPEEKRQEYSDMWEEVARDSDHADSPGAMTWEKLTKEILEKVGK